MFAEIIVNKDAKQLNKVFDYIVPKRFEKEIRVGARVSVPFARNKKPVNGFVVSLKENSEFANKEIISIENNYLTEKDIKLAELMARRYFCNVSECIKLMLPAGTKEKEKKIKRVSLKLKDVEKDAHHKLNEEQKQAFDKVNETIQSNVNKEFLLYGVTGSGKTEVYLQLLDNILKKGKSAIVLVPEISLTPQIINRFIARFGENEVAVLHSKLTTGQRFDAWHKVHSGEAKIVIGARSAIFAPVKNLGLVIIDEEHDLSYKSDMTPRFNAKEIARYMCKQNNAPLLLGSATPDLNTFYKTYLKNIELLRLSKRANNASLPEVEIVDLRQELVMGNRTMISTKLFNAIQENVKNNQQTILFLNRRGFSTFVMCRECGHTLKCKNCNISLTYHSKENILKCHYCGYKAKPVTICPECGSKKIKYLGTGTQKLETEIQKMFPGISTIRMDVDTIKKDNTHEDILNRFKGENINILIGTQMVVKGHHFPNVTLVGAIIADSSLNIEDYRATERTFQLLTQVAGRAGRENLPGKVIIQTYNPENYSIIFSKEQDYDKFYKTEINLRKRLKYPPFCDIISINLVSNSEKNVVELSGFIYRELINSNLKDKMSVFKPMPSPIDKIKNKIRWRIIIKCKFDNNIINLLSGVLNKCYSLNYKDTGVIVDVNPNSFV